MLQGDLDLGRLAADALAAEDLGRHVLVEELHYGAVAVAQRLQELEPIGLVLVGAAESGRPNRASAGAVRRRRVGPDHVELGSAQQAIAEAGTGYVGIDLIIDVARALDGLPDRTVVIEVEPLTVGPGLELSAPARRGLGCAVSMVREEVARMPVLDLGDRLRPLLVTDPPRLEPSAALDALAHLLEELDRLDAEGQLGHTFRWRDRLRQAISDGRTSQGMDHLDWGLWWALIEALDRLEISEAS